MTFLPVSRVELDSQFPIRLLHNLQTHGCLLCVIKAGTILHLLEHIHLYTFSYLNAVAQRSDQMGGVIIYQIHVINQGSEYWGFFYALRYSQQFFSHVGMISRPPGLNQY